MRGIFLGDVWNSILGYEGEGPRSLQKSRLGVNYLRLLERAWSSVRDFNESRGGPTLLEQTRRSAPANALLVDDLQHVYEAKKRMSWGRLAILAVQHFRRHLEGRLHVAWDSIESWQAEVELTHRLRLRRHPAPAVKANCSPVIQLFEESDVCSAFSVRRRSPPLHYYQVSLKGRTSIS